MVVRAGSWDGQVVSRLAPQKGKGRRSSFFLDRLVIEWPRDLGVATGQVARLYQLCSIRISGKSVEELASWPSDKREWC